MSRYRYYWQVKTYFEIKTAYNIAFTRPHNMTHFSDILTGEDLRSIGQSNNVVSLIKNQDDFDGLFEQIFNIDRKVVMRAVDAIEKITLNSPEYLGPHKRAIFQLCNTAKNVELKWHLALLVARLSLTKKEIGSVWQTLTNWARDPDESKIVRVNSLQGLFHLLTQYKELEQDFNLTVTKVEEEEIPSIDARIRKIKNSGC